MFWIFALAICGLVTAVLVTGIRRSGSSRAEERAVTVYKDQLAEIARDEARGAMDPDEAEALKLEVSRRLLAADRAAAAAPVAAPPRARQVLIWGTVAAVIGGGLAIYAAIGGGGLPDQPRTQRIAQNAAEYAARATQAEMRQMLEARGAVADPQADPEHAELMTRLRTALETRPGDAQGWRLLADNRARLGQWDQAAEAQARLVALLGPAATATDQANLAEYRILAVNGYVSPQAEAALIAALERDPREPRARYYSGLGALQAGRADLTYDMWIRLLSESDDEAPWAQAIRRQIANVALAAGRQVPERLATAPAPEMTPDDIRGMVSGLAARLAQDGGPPEDWARLIRSYGVLGERGAASQIWNEAQAVFADAPAALALIRQAAQEAEVQQ
ncbi:MAG: c-type cytochrome biogenesis protein CcmI [Pseudomonadota bacterium]